MADEPYAAHGGGFLWPDLPMGRGGLDLKTSARQAMDAPRMAADPATRLFAVSIDRKVCVAAHDGQESDGCRLHFVDMATRSAMDFAKLYSEGKLWHIGYVQGAPYMAFLADSSANIGQGAWMRIRHAGARLAAGQATACSHALALAVWHRSVGYCGRCGTATSVGAAGWERHCRQCKAIEYPRQDPAVIVAVVDASQRLLLAHNVLWDNPASYSVIAGYVEAGESPENAARREVHEETGLRLSGLEYIGSQAWPFPRSLMMGYMAICADGQLRLDAEELSDGGFYTRQRFIDDVVSGAMQPPGPSTIASTLIERWLKQPIPYTHHFVTW